MQRFEEGASRARLGGVRATVVTLAVLTWSATLTACVIPPTMPALRHTGRLAPPSASGLFRVGGTTDFNDVAGPDLGWRFRLEERVELDVSGYGIVAISETYPNYAALGRVGIGIGLIEREHGALALLAGVGVGGLHEENDGYGPSDEPPEHFEGSSPLVGGDLGIAGSLRYFGWFEPYIGFRWSTVALLGDDEAQTVMWLMPSLGVRFLADRLVAVSVEWTNGVYLFPEAPSDCCEWMTGASLAIELGPNGS